MFISKVNEKNLNVYINFFTNNNEYKIINFNILLYYFLSF